MQLRKKEMKRMASVTRSRATLRRDFLRAGGGAALGGVLAAHTFDLEAEQVAAVPAGDAVRFGIIGVGTLGSALLTNAVTVPGVQCVAASDLYDGRHTLAREIAGPDIKTTRWYQELLDDKSIECLIVAVPDFWHKTVVVDALSAGKDVYCEKPMSHTIAEGAEMVKAVERTGKFVQVGSQRVRGCDDHADSQGRTSASQTSAFACRGRSSIRNPNLGGRGGCERECNYGERLRTVFQAAAEEQILREELRLELRARRGFLPS
jgi:hypothetical protein